jgi:hypothetical protein
VHRRGARPWRDAGRGRVLRRASRESLGESIAYASPAPTSPRPSLTWLWVAWVRGAWVGGWAACV